MDDALAGPLTTIQAAARLGLSPRQVRHLASKGRIEGARKLGRDWVFDPRFKVVKNGTISGIRNGS